MQNLVMIASSIELNKYSNLMRNFKSRKVQIKLILNLVIGGPVNGRECSWHSINIPKMTFNLASQCSKGVFLGSWDLGTKNSKVNN